MIAEAGGRARVRSEPQAPGASVDFGSPGDVAACHALLARGSKSFSAAARVLPRRVRDAAAVLYAFCRVADDAVDLGQEADRVDRLRARLQMPRHFRADRIAAFTPCDERYPQRRHGLLKAWRVAQGIEAL